MKLRERYGYQGNVVGEPKSIAIIRSPFNGDPLAEIECADWAMAEQALHLARTIHDGVAGAVPAPAAHLRADILNAASKAILANAEFFARLIALEGGKPLRDAQVEVNRAAMTLQLCAHEAVFAHGEEVPMRATPAAYGHLAMTMREPIGPVLAISAFNHPLNLVAHQVGAALAAGCPVVVKPALETPLSCWHLLDLLYQAGLPVDMAQAIYCDNDVAEKMAASSVLGQLNFIGSARVGWHLRRHVAPGVRIALEHGGAAPVILDESADFDQAIPLLVRGGYYHSGQVCVSVQRIFVHQSRIDEFLERYRAAVAALQTGDPSHAETDCGPLIRTTDVERVSSWVTQAINEGAQALCGGKPIGQTMYAPTILRNAKLSSRVMREEIFGPVVCVNAFTDMDQAIALANQVPFTFQAAIFSQRVSACIEGARALRATAVMVNESPTFRVDWMPFAGGDVSGLGIGGVPHAVREMSYEKLLVVRA